MSNLSPSRLVALSQKIYRRLLSVYPKSHRRDFGDPMAQLFQDQTRAAWAEARLWGLATLWFRTSIDTVATAASEHFQNLKNRKSMFRQITFSPFMKSSPTSVFVILFVAVLIFASVITLMLPKAYASKARVIMAGGSSSSPQTELLVVQSDVVLDRVISDLGLNKRWQQKFHTDSAFSTAESRPLLRKMFQVSRIPDTRLIDITVFSDDNNEAAVIANSLAKAYAESNHASRRAEVEQTGRIPGEPPVEILDNAEPALRPIYPNIPLNIFCGTFLAALVGAGGVMLTRLLRRLAGSRTAVPVS